MQHLLQVLYVKYTVQSTNEAVFFNHTETTQGPSKQGRRRLLRGADSFLGKWEPAGLDKYTQTEPRPVCGLNTSRLCLFTLSALSLLYLFSLACPLALRSTLNFTFLCTFELIQ